MITPRTFLVAKKFVELGFDTRRKLIEHLAERTLISARENWANMWSRRWSGRRGAVRDAACV